MDRLARFRRAGFGIAIGGLVIASLSLVPQLSPREQFPWPLMVGAFVYLPGAFFVLVGSRGANAREVMGRLRFVRLGFVAVFAIVVWRMLSL